jgi:copper-binding protein NosD
VPASNIATSFALALILVSTVQSMGTTYYVSSSTGKDGNSGRTSSSPWKTIARVNSQPLQPGDHVLLRRGDSWRETLRPPASGAPDSFIVFDAYGSGPRPVLIGGNAAGQDVNIDNNEQSYLEYRGLELRGARQGLRLYAWRRIVVRGITLADSVISTGSRELHGAMSAGVYVNVDIGRIEQLTIRRNHFIPYPVGVEHWGVYFVKGVTDFRIEDNSFGPAGEDAICVWHSSHGVIARNHGGGNGENTVDVKDSHDIVISENVAEEDTEYNIVVHRVDAGEPTHNVRIERNTCRRGGKGGKLPAGIALLFVERTMVTNNVVEEPYREAIYVRDENSTSANNVWNNRIVRARSPANVAAVILENAPGTHVLNNQDLASFTPTR